MARQVKYFPAGVLSNNKRGDQFKSEWYSKQLQALEEPSLWELSKGPTPVKESYRFLWLRTFHQPVAIRVDMVENGTARLTVKMANGAGGYAPGKLIQNETLTLTKERTDRFLTLIEKNAFWKLPTLEESKMGCDGAQWVIEGVKGGTYHLVDRWSPDDGEVRAIGLSMINDLAKLKIPAKELY
jgi:hypothetical protein